MNDQTPPSGGDTPRIRDDVSWRDSTTYSMELPSVMKKFAEAGVPRSIRTLQRYCENGSLDARKYDVELGETWFVNADSVQTRIDEIKQHAAIASNDDTPTPRQTNDAMTAGTLSRENENEVPPSIDVEQRQKADDTEWRPEKIEERHMTSDDDTKYVSLPVAVLDVLTAQLEAKDDQIKIRDEQLNEAGKLMDREREAHQQYLILLGKAMEVISEGRFELPGQKDGEGNEPDQPKEVMSAVEQKPIDEAEVGAAEWAEIGGDQTA